MGQDYEIQTYKIPAPITEFRMPTPVTAQSKLLAQQLVDSTSLMQYQSFKLK
jgi:hypothetical protein